MDKDDNGLTRRDFIKAASMATLVAAVSGSGGRWRRGLRRDPRRRHRLRRARHGAASTPSTPPRVESWPSTTVQDRIASCLKRLQEKVPAAVKVTPRPASAASTATRSCWPSRRSTTSSRRAPRFRPSTSRRPSRRARTSSWRSRSRRSVGVRSVIASSALAAKKGLAIVAGTQRRHQQSYLETLKRIHDGAIGEIVGGQCYWNQGDLWVIKQTPEMSDMEWQCRTGSYFSWTSGDHIVEQHVHNIDVMNWAFNATPVKVMGMGGRQVRTAPEYGNIFDHFAVEFEYPNGVRVMSMCRQTKGCADRSRRRSSGPRATPSATARSPGRAPGSSRPRRANPYVVEHTDLIASIRAASRSTKASASREHDVRIMGRMSAYTGRAISWIGP